MKLDEISAKVRRLAFHKSLGSSSLVVAGRKAEDMDTGPQVVKCTFFMLIFFFFFYSRQKGREGGRREKKRERHIGVREKHQ